ncbi:hypothetical protein GCM10007049_12870 [Echinicola pacifica]|uniref:DUF2520 domain-containing protein n=1 Tax=Echinicola pacifica TaxID=346377 RepID=A0A918PV10_9BACT|nr:hypothetical protein GCM10007049_12870 [Echinicola pacifica]
MDIAIIGTGNVAWHLAPALENAGHTITEVYSREAHRADKITNQLYTAEVKTDLDFSDSTANIFIIAVSDHAITNIADAIILPEGSVLVHTSGSMPLEVLSYSSATYTGIFYPLQSFSKSRKMDIDEVPFLIESDDQTTLQKLKKLAKSLSPRYYQVKSKDRQALHIAAVFASNFTNHMIRLSEEIMRRQGLDFEMLQPLIIEQISKALEQGAKASQTGPAVRGDLNVLDMHYQFLNYNDQIAELYKLISQDIIDAN